MKAQEEVVNTILKAVGDDPIAIFFSLQSAVAEILKISKPNIDLPMTKERFLDQAAKYDVLIQKIVNCCEAFSRWKSGHEKWLLENIEKANGGDDFAVISVRAYWNACALNLRMLDAEKSFSILSGNCTTMAKILSSIDLAGFVVIAEVK